MSPPFDTTTLPEPTEEKMKILMAAIMQNSLMVQQLQLMVALEQKEIREKENRKRRERDEKEEEEKQTKLIEEELRMMRMWGEEESRQYVERFRGYRGDKRCKRCSWFGHMAYQCRREEIETEREQRGGSGENRWEPLRCRMMRCNEEREAARSIRSEVQQEVKCWGCGEAEHRLWTCPTKAACPAKGKAQQERKVVCRACKGEGSYYKKLRRLLEVEGMGFEGGSEEAKRTKDRGVDKEGEGVEEEKGKGKRGGKSGKVHYATSKRSLDESWIGKD